MLTMKLDLTFKQSFSCPCEDKGKGNSQSFSCPLVLTRLPVSLSI